MWPASQASFLPYFPLHLAPSGSVFLWIRSNSHFLLPAAGSEALPLLQGHAVISKHSPTSPDPAAYWLDLGLLSCKVQFYTLSRVLGSSAAPSLNPAWQAGWPHMAGTLPVNEKARGPFLSCYLQDA